MDIPAGESSWKEANINGELFKLAHSEERKHLRIIDRALIIKLDLCGREKEEGFSMAP